MALDIPGFGYTPPKKKRRINIPGIGSFPDVGDVTLPPPIQNAVSPNPQPNTIDWRQLIEADPLYQGGLADIGGESAADRARTLGGLRQALIRFGGKGLQGTLGKLGAGWEDAIDPTTIGAAAAGDTAGTSISAQLEKAHKDRLLAEEDIRAAKGILSSGQSGYEIGEERQRNTIAGTDAVNALLDFLSGLTGGFAGREGERGVRRGQLGDDASRRIGDLGLEPPPPPPLPDFGNVFRPRPRRPIRRTRGRGIQE